MASLLTNRSAIRSSGNKGQKPVKRVSNCLAGQAIRNPTYFSKVELSTLFSLAIVLAVRKISRGSRPPTRKNRAGSNRNPLRLLPTT
jgi:hypothetical protein